jgi:hypothetical protein
MLGAGGYLRLPVAHDALKAGGNTKQPHGFEAKVIAPVAEFTQGAELGVAPDGRSGEAGKDLGVGRA